MTTAGDLLQLIRSGRAASRSDLVRLTGLSRTAVQSRLSALIDAGLVLAGDERASTGGRPAGGLDFNHDAGVVLAAAIGGSRSQLAVFDLEGRELAASAVGHEVGAAPDVVMPQAAQRSGGAARRTCPDRGPVLGTGISLPGTVDPVRGVSLDSPVMVGWDGVDLAGYLRRPARRRRPGPVLVGNDADVLARSERLGHALDLRRPAGGEGLHRPGPRDPRRGPDRVGPPRRAPARSGTPRSTPPTGRRCRCGDSGCLETFAAGWALVGAAARGGSPGQPRPRPRRVRGRR